MLDTLSAPSCFVHDAFYDTLERIKVTRPTAYGYLSTLTEAGYARNENGEYYLSYRILGIGNRLKYREPLFRASKIPLRKLVSDIGEPAFIGIEESGDWVVLHRSGDISSIDIRTYSGLRLPLHTHAAGKIILTEMEPEQRDEIIESRGLQLMTDKTLTEREELESEEGDSMRIPLKSLERECTTWSPKGRSMTCATERVRVTDLGCEGTGELESQPG